MPKQTKWPLLRSIEPGDKLKADGGFTCLKPGAIRTVYYKKEYGLYIRCKEGVHVLEDQLGSKRGTIGRIVGLEKVK